MTLFDRIEGLEVHPPDYEHFGDLAALAVGATKPILKHFIRGKNGFEATEDFKSGIEAKINEFFADKHWALLPEWKTSAMWENFEYAVAFVDETVNKNAGKFVYDSIVGILVAFTIETPSGFKVRYYDKIGLKADKRGNGYMSDLIKEARKIDLELDKERESEKTFPTPAALRTSETDNDVRYKKSSDYRVVSENTARKTEYFVHLYDFKNKEKKPIIPYVDRMYEVAGLVGNLPETFKKAA